jgi:hypothetical protein
MSTTLPHPLNITFISLLTTLVGGMLEVGHVAGTEEVATSLAPSTCSVVNKIKKLVLMWHTSYTSSTVPSTAAGTRIDVNKEIRIGERGPLVDAGSLDSWWSLIDNR